jgi:iron complex outermembrane receptor protein
VLIFGSISRANKAGDFNAPLGLTGGPEIMPYDPEVLTAYEIGFKSTFFDGSTRLNGSTYYYDYADYQAFQFLGIGALVFNTDAEIYGAELDLATIPGEGWEIVLGISWLDSTAKNINLPSGIVRDQVTPSSPEWTYNGLVRKGWNAGNGEFYVQGDFNYVSTQTSSVINHPSLDFDSYTVGNIKIGYVAADGRWEASVFVKNVTEEEYLTYGFQGSAITGGSNVTPGWPRWWGVNFRYNWN